MESKTKEETENKMEEHKKEEPKRRKRSGKETEKMISGHKEENDKREERKSAFHPFLLSSLSLLLFFLLKDFIF